jgi:hypothetical protein
MFKFWTRNFHLAFIYDPTIQQKAWLNMPGWVKPVLKNGWKNTKLYEHTSTARRKFVRKYGPNISYVWQTSLNLKPLLPGFSPGTFCLHTNSAQNTHLICRKLYFEVVFLKGKFILSSPAGLKDSRMNRQCFHITVHVSANVYSYVQMTT